MEEPDSNGFYHFYYLYKKAITQVVDTLEHPGIDFQSDLLYFLENSKDTAFLKYVIHLSS